MEYKPVIFKNLDLYEAISGNLSPIDCKDCETKIVCVKEWYSTPPSFTTVRVNSLLSSLEEVEEFVNKSLNVEAVKREQPGPKVWRHPELPDLLVLDPWTPAQPIGCPQRDVVVDAACGAAVLRGAHVFAPGVLAVPSDTRVGDEVSVYADTGGHCRRGLSVPYNDPGKAYVGCGIMNMSRKQLFHKDTHPKGVAVEVLFPASHVSSVILPPQLGILQNLPSIVCSQVLNPRPEERVIDLCAAPGHKTTHLAALMQNQGVLIALDKVARKVEALHSLCQTMGADMVKVFKYDATQVVSHDAGTNWSPPYAPDTFDHVLLDAPCSALGLRPQLGNRITCKQLASHPKLQRKLFKTAVELVRPGGSLVYSTCSVCPAENEDIVSWALESYPQLELVPADPRLGGPGSPKSSLTDEQRHMVQRFGPPIGTSPDSDTIGFFIAKFIKLR